MKLLYLQERAQCRILPVRNLGNITILKKESLIYRNVKHDLKNAKLSYSLEN